MRAIRAGALTAIAKPPGALAPDFEAARASFLATVKSMASVKVVGHRRTSGSLLPPPTVVRPHGLVPHVRAEMVALGASTGGPGALRAILDALPSDFPAPVLVVQHLAAGFTEGFAAYLGTTCRLRVSVATHGGRTTPGNVYIAPEESHLTVSPGGVLWLARTPPVESFRPSCNVLFESLAQSYGRRGLAAILTGMGRDGVVGLRRVRELGGRILAQDEHTCSVFGMPAAAIAEGLPDVVLPISSIASKIIELVAQETP
jgi:two-component system chemotaxis response regulator CheB